MQSRRNFLASAAASALGVSLFDENCASGAALAGELDRFGGWKDKRFKATGFFRTEHDGQRWWLVTPEGNAFLSFGINHFQSYIFRQPHNKAAWRRRLGVDNLNDKSKFNPAYRDWALEVCRDYGINTLAMGTDLHILNRPAPAIPYIQRIGFLEIYHSNRNVVDEDFLDVFSHEFATRCDRLAKSIAAPHKEDPQLLGYCMIDCPTFTEEDCAEKRELTFWSSPPQPERVGFPRRLRNLGAQAPGKQAYVRTMREVYHDDIKNFNATYDTSFDSFDSLAHAARWRPDTDPYNQKERRDNNTFLQVVVAKYYETARDAIRRHDPNHMFLGDRLNGNTDTVDTVLQTTGKYTDFVFFQMYNWYEFVDVFDKAFEDKCERVAADICARRANDPYLPGYCMNDCPLFTEENLRERVDVIGGARRAKRSLGFPRRLRNLGTDAPGKQVYVRVMRNVYEGQIGKFNLTYDTSFESWDALASAVNWRPETQLSNSNETRDNLEFMHVVVDRYYQCASEAIRRYDPNHLFFGDKLNANTDACETFLKTTTKYTDLLFYQMYAKYEVQRFGMDRWSTLIDVPMLNGDSSYTQVTPSMPHPYGPIASSVEERIEWTETFFKSAFARPDFVGWHYCGFIDADNNMERVSRKYRQHSGCMTTYGVPYPGVKESLKELSNNIYRIGTGSI